MKQVNNALYKTSLVIGASAVKQVLWYFCNLIFIKNKFLPGSVLRVIVLRLFGARLGKGVVIKPGVTIKFPWKLSVGDNSWIGEDVWIDNLADVFIGSSVCLSQGVYILTGNHNYKKVTFDLMVAGVVLQDGVWAGAFSVICPGVTCATHAVLSVASVANINLQPYGIYKGNPAVKVGERVMD